MKEDKWVRKEEGWKDKGRENDVSYWLLITCKNWTALVTFTYLNLLEDRCELRKNKTNKSTPIPLILFIASAQNKNGSIFGTTSILSQNTHSDRARASIMTVKEHKSCKTMSLLSMDSFKNLLIIPQYSDFPIMTTFIFS